MISVCPSRGLRVWVPGSTQQLRYRAYGAVVGSTGTRDDHAVKREHDMIGTDVLRGGNTPMHKSKSNGLKKKKRNLPIVLRQPPEC